MLGAVRLYDNDSVIDKVVEQLLLRCNKIIIFLTGNCTADRIPKSKLIQVAKDKHKVVLNGQSLQRMVTFIKSEGLPDYLVYPDQDEILPVQWPSCIDFLENSNKYFDVGFKYLTCWDSISAVLPTKYSYPLDHHSKVAKKWQNGFAFLPSRGYCKPNTPKKTRHKSNMLIRHTALMTKELRENFWNTKIRSWRNSDKPKWAKNGRLFCLGEAIKTNMPPKLLQFDERKQWQDYPTE